MLKFPSLLFLLFLVGSRMSLGLVMGCIQTKALFVVESLCVV
jgi:hypothetical protein